MFGWKARIGVILAAPNTVCEPELNLLAPPGVSIHAARLFSPPGAPASATEIYRSRPSGGSPVSRDVLSETNETLAQAAGSLSHIKPDLVVFAHTLGGMFKGKLYNEELTRMMEHESGSRALTSATAVVAALNAMGIRKLSVVTPYAPILTEIEKEYLQQEVHGLEIVKDLSLDLESPLVVGKLHPDAAYQAAKQADHQAAEAIFLSGTNWRTIGIIQALEEDLGKPVITATQATFWVSLRILSIRGVTGYGSLFLRN